MDVIRRLSPRCREAARVISYAAEERLALLDRVGIFLHVLICTPCRRYQRSVMVLKRRMKQLTDLSEQPLAAAAATTTPPAMPADARARVRAVIETAAGSPER